MVGGRPSRRVADRPRASGTSGKSGTSGTRGRRGGTPQGDAWARPRTTRPATPRTRPGAARPGTARHRASTGSSTRASTPIRASTAPNTSRAPARWPRIRPSRGPPRTSRRSWRRRSRRPSPRRLTLEAGLALNRRRAPPAPAGRRSRPAPRPQIRLAAEPAPAARSSAARCGATGARPRPSVGDPAAAWDAARMRAARRTTDRIARRMAPADRRCHPRPARRSNRRPGPSRGHRAGRVAADRDRRRGRDRRGHRLQRLLGRVRRHRFAAPVARPGRDPRAAAPAAAVRPAACRRHRGGPARARAGDRVPPGRRRRRRARGGLRARVPARDRVDPRGCRLDRGDPPARRAGSRGRRADEPRRRRAGTGRPRTSPAPRRSTCSPSGSWPATAPGSPPRRSRASSA